MLFRRFVSVTSLIALSTMANPVQAQSRNNHNIALFGAEFGVYPIDCKVAKRQKAEITIYYEDGTKEDKWCFSPNDKLPAGTYRYFYDTGTLSAVNIYDSRGIRVDDPNGIISKEDKVEGNRSERSNENPYEQQNPYSSSRGDNNGRNFGVVGPTIPISQTAPQQNFSFYTLTGEPIPPHAKGALQSILVGHGLSSSDCNTAQVHVIVNKKYGACAHPNALYSPGKYAVTYQGLQ